MHVHASSELYSYNYGSSFLPPVYQGTTLGTAGASARDAKIRDLVLREFEDSLDRSDELIAGGRKQALNLVQSTLEPDRASKILEKLGRDEKRIDWTLRAYQPPFIAERLAAEHPQTIALVISHYLSKRVRLRRLAIYGLLGLTLSILVGIARSPSLRPLFAADPVAVAAGGRG